MSKATPKIRLVTINAIGKPTKTNSRIIPDIIKYIPITKIKSNNIKANTIKIYSYLMAFVASVVLASVGIVLLESEQAPV